MLASSLSQLNRFNFQCLNVFTKRRFPPSLPFRRCAVVEIGLGLGLGFILGIWKFFQREHQDIKIKKTRKLPVPMPTSL